MGFSYKPLFRLLVDRNMKKTDLHTEVGLSSATLAKLSKGEPLSGESVEKLCLYFRCQIGELVEYVFEDTPAKTTEAAKPAQPVQKKTAFKAASKAASRPASKHASKNRPAKTRRGAKP